VTAEARPCYARVRGSLSLGVACCLTDVGFLFPSVTELLMQDDGGNVPQVLGYDWLVPGALTCPRGRKISLQLIFGLLSHLNTCSWRGAQLPEMSESVGWDDTLAVSGIQPFVVTQRIAVSLSPKNPNYGIGLKMPRSTRCLTARCPVDPAEISFAGFISRLFGS